MPPNTPLRLAATAIAVLSSSCTQGPVASDRADLQRAVDAAILPLLAEHELPGMAIAVSLRGEHHHFEYGVASREEPARPVTQDTLFEIGSVSKTFTAALGSYAVVQGALALDDPVSEYVPALRGTAFDSIRLLHLATYTAGGLPLQVPAEVRDEATMLAYFRSWRPEFAPGTQRCYGNPSIGLFGHLAARSLGRPFEALMEEVLLRELDLRQTFLEVPPEHLADYAQGYTKDGQPIRVAPGWFDAEAYGVKTTASDLLRFVEAHLRCRADGSALEQALLATHTGYFALGGMTQGLGWELYADPTPLETLLAGNSREALFEPNPVTALVPPRPPRGDLLLQKTGSTNGFGAYVAFVPARRIGIVLLANKSYPIEARVRAAHRILESL